MKKISHAHGSVGLTVKMAILQKKLTESNLQIQCKFESIKIPTQFCTDLKRTLVNFTWRNKNPGELK